MRERERYLSLALPVNDGRLDYDPARNRREGWVNGIEVPDRSEVPDMTVGPGEFSGGEGIIQGEEHDPTKDASESLYLLRQQDEADLAEQIEALKPEG